MPVSRKRVGIVKNDGSGFKHQDFSTAALNELRANARPQDFGTDQKYVLPVTIGKDPAPGPGETTVDPVAQSTHPYQSGGQ